MWYSPLENGLTVKVVYREIYLSTDIAKCNFKAYEYFYSKNYPEGLTMDLALYAAQTVDLLSCKKWLHAKQKFTKFSG